MAFSETFTNLLNRIQTIYNCFVKLTSNIQAIA